MISEGSLDKSKIVEVFHTMEIGNEFEDLKSAHEAIKSKLSSDNGIKILSQVTNEIVAFVDANDVIEITASVKWNYDNFKPIEFINAIIPKLRREIKFLIHLEIIIRGFLYKEAEKSVNDFINYLDCHLVSVDITTSEFVLLDNMPLSLFGHFLRSIIRRCYGQKIIIKASSKFYIIVKAIFDIIHHDCKEYELNLKIQPLVDAEQRKIVNSPVIVFNDADLNSACDILLHAAFAEQGQMPWSVNTIYVQDDVMNLFVDKLKFQLHNLTWGPMNNKQVDFSYPYLIEDYLERYASLIRDAKTKGLDVFTPCSDQKSGIFQPTLIIGGKLYNNGILKPSTPTVPYLNILGFRTRKEGVTLLNNENQPFSAGVWSNNIGVLTKIVHEINADNIWINSHGVFNPKEPYSFNGISYTGCLLSIEGEKRDLSSLLKEKTEKCQKAQTIWSQKSYVERVHFLNNYATTVYEKANKTEKAILTKNSMIQKFHGALWGSNFMPSVRVYGSYEYKQINKPKGVILYKTANLKKINTYIMTIFREGNGLILQFPNQEVDNEYYRLFVKLQEHLGDLFVLIPSEENYDSFNMKLEESEDDHHTCEYKNVWTSLSE